jgi:hypothetical protein
MAKNPKQGASTKRVGGGSAPAGNYIISRIFVSDEETEINKQTVKYDGLNVGLIPAVQQGNTFVAAAGAKELDATLMLNGCWRTRYDAKGVAHKASGTFIDWFIQNCSGQTFDEVVAFMTTNPNDQRNRAISIAYDSYQSVYGSAEGKVPVVNYL